MKKDEDNIIAEQDNILFDDYTRLKRVGDGGYATVYKVRHNKLRYIRAIRVLKENVDSVDEPVFKKFIKECKVLLRLGNGNHPNIIHIYQPLFNEKSGKAFVEMDYITGEDIKQYIERKKFVPIDEIIKFVKEIGSALAYCHVDIYKYSYDRELDDLKDDPNDGSKPLIDDRKRLELIEEYRVIHNDIHSGNIMRKDDGHYILLDFGLAIEEGDLIRKSQRTNGAPEYKSPEKWDNDNDVTPQSDIYSFGIVLYEMLTGHVPFAYNRSLSQFKAESQLRDDHLNKMPKPIVEERKKRFEEVNRGKKYENDVPNWLVELVGKCLSKEPSDRFIDGLELFEFIKGNEEKEIQALKNRISELNEEISKIKAELVSVQLSQSPYVKNTELGQNLSSGANDVPHKDKRKRGRHAKPWANQVENIYNEKNK